MTKQKLYILTALGAIIDIIMVLYVINYPAFYIVSIVHAMILKKLSKKNTEFRLHQLGYALRRTTEEKIGEIILNIGTLIPIANTILFSKMYFQSFAEDEKLLKDNRYIIEPYKQAVYSYRENQEEAHDTYFQVVEKEEDIKLKYEKLSKQEYELALKMVELEQLVDKIATNKNLDKETKEKILIELRTKILLNKKIEGKVKKLTK